MSPSAPILCLVAALQASGAAAPPPEAVRLEVLPPARPVYAGEVLTVTVVLDLDAEFRRRLVPLTLRPLDLPVALETGWPGARPVPAAEGLSLAVDGAVTRARQEAVAAPGRLRLAVALGLRLERPGELRLPGPRLRLAWTGGFREDPFLGRVAAGRRDAVVTGPETVFRILPLPAAGRPPGFAGAVGRFRLAVHCDRREVAVGESFRLRLEILGDDAALDGFPPPDPELPGFHVYGFLEERAPGRRIVLYDLAALDASVTAIPPLELATFDPTPPARWRVLRTTAVPIRVRPAPGAAPQAPPAPATGGLPLRSLLAGAATLFVLAALLLRARRHRRRG